MQIRKSDGRTVSFDEAQLARSLRRARVETGMVKEVVSEIAKMVRPGTSTLQIHERTLHYLEKRDLTSAARFNLKHAMLALGPTGYPFEEYVAKLMQAYGWTTKVGVTVPGKCIEHEVDVYGERKGSKKRAVEAKYHNRAGGRSDVKVALYVYARHLDLEARDPNVKGVLITNTEFTNDAMLYGECVGMKMKAWNYPKDEGLNKYIEQKNLYPVTVFAQIQKRVVSNLIRDGIVLAEQLCELSYSEAKKYQFNEETFEQIQKHARQLCDSDTH
jgi:hypothetical protein